MSRSSVVVFFPGRVWGESRAWCTWSPLCPVSSRDMNLYWTRPSILNRYSAFFCGSRVAFVGFYWLYVPGSCSVS